MAYINYQGNIFADCAIVNKPKYREEVGEYKKELTKVFAKCREQTPEGVQTVNLDLCFFSALAIPAMKLTPGMCIIVLGRESTKELYTRGKNTLERTVIVDWWTAREIDPVGMLEELKARRMISSKEKELQQMVAEWLEKCLPIIIANVAEEIKNKNLEE